LYTTNPEELQRKFIELKNEITTHTIQLMIQPDKNWGVYTSFVK
jgi:hypothetical protein